MAGNQNSNPYSEKAQAEDAKTEKKITDIIGESMAASTLPIDKFTSWLLALTGATGALLLTQVNSVLPYISERGFKVSMGMLLVSGLCGFASKHISMICQVSLAGQRSTEKAMGAIMEEHKLAFGRIQKEAENHNIMVSSDISLSRIFVKLLIHLPKWQNALFIKHLFRALDNWDEGNAYFVGYIFKQAIWTYLQAISFVVFMLVATSFVADIG